jgi:hypothetical protein
MERWRETGKRKAPKHKGAQESHRQVPTSTFSREGEDNGRGHCTPSDEGAVGNLEAGLGELQIVCGQTRCRTISQGNASGPISCTETSVHVVYLAYDPSVVLHGNRWTERQRQIERHRCPPLRVRKAREAASSGQSERAPPLLGEPSEHPISQGVRLFPRDHRQGSRATIFFSNVLASF